MLIEIIIGSIFLLSITALAHKFPVFCIEAFFTIVLTILFIGSSWGFGKALIEIIKYIRIL